MDPLARGEDAPRVRARQTFDFVVRAKVRGRNGIAHVGRPEGFHLIESDVALIALLDRRLGSKHRLAHRRVRCRQTT